MNILIISDEDKKSKKLKYKEGSKKTQKEISEILKNEKKDDQSKLTEEQENNIKFLKELGIDFNELNESHKEKAKNTKLNNEQIENIKTIIYDLGINVKIDFIDKVKDIKLEEEQIKNIKIIKNELSFRVGSNDIDKIKDIKLKNEQIENMKTIIYDLGINVGIDFIDKVKNIKLNEEQIKNIKIIQNELGFYITKNEINEIKDIKLNEEQIRNIKKIDSEIGISTSLNDIDIIKDVKLDEEQIKNIKIIKNELGFNVNFEFIKEIKQIEASLEDINIIKLNEMNNNFSNEAIKRIKQKIRDFGINMEEHYTTNLEDIKLTEEQIRNIKILNSELGLNIFKEDIEKLKDIKLGEEQIKNIKIIQNELGFYITKNEINEIKDIKLDEEQIKNIKIIKNELGISISKEDINTTKDINLNDEQIKNIKIMKNELGIKISKGDINEIKDIKLDKEQIKNIKIIKNELGIKISKEDINTIKDINLNDGQIKNIKIMKNELGIKISKEDINTIKDINLDDEQIKNIKKLKYEILFDIYSPKYFKKINETDFDINKLEQLKKLGIEITQYNIIKLNETNFDIKKLEQLKKLGINIKLLLQIIDNKEQDFDINKLDTNKLEQLKILGIDVKENNIIELNKPNYDFNKLREIKEKLKNYGINIDRHNVIELNKTDIDFNKLKQLKNLGININKQNIIKLNKTNFDFNKLKEIKEKIKEFGINMDENNIIELNNIKLGDFQRIKEIYDEYGFIICISKNEWDKQNLSEKERTILKKAYNIFKENGIIIPSTEEIKVILDIIGNTVENKKNYIDKKNKFLRENQTLSDERFDELFKNGIDKGKYGIQNIHQTDLGYCYAYTGFELLKKSNFFDIIIKTSMKETETGWEIKIPLGDPNGHIIKVNKEEIDKKFSYKSIDDGKYKKNININSESSLGFKILEIAFIKEYIINPPEYIINPPKDNEKDYLYCKIRKEFLEKSGKKSEYERTGDIEITGELLNIVEGGDVNNFFKKMILKTTHGYETDNLNSIKKLFDFVNSGSVKIGLSYNTHEMSPKKIKRTLKDGSECPIDSDHAYSVEKMLIDNKTGEKYIIFVNPRNTSKKHKVTLDECIKIFNNAEITTIDINKLFNNN